MNSLPLPEFPMEYEYHFEDCRSPVSKHGSKKSYLNFQDLPDIDVSSLDKFQLESEAEDIMNA